MYEKTDCPLELHKTALQCEPSDGACECEPQEDRVMSHVGVLAGVSLDMLSHMILSSGSNN